MKSRKLKRVLPLFALPLVLSFRLHAEPAPLIEVPVRHVFFPESGYDEDDEIQLVIEGELPDPCYELGKQSFSRDETGTITLHSYAWRHSTKACDTGDLLTESPYSAQSSLGTLKAGDYRVAFSPDDGSVDYRKLHVDARKSSAWPSPGNAQVTSVAAPEVVLEGQPIQIVIHGLVASPCNRLPDAIPVSRQGDTVVVGPIELRAGVCSHLLPPFERKIDLGILPPGEYLLYVRSDAGKSIEKTVRVIRTHPVIHPPGDQNSSTSSKDAPLRART